MKKNNKIKTYLTTLILVMTVFLAASCSDTPDRKAPVGREHRAFIDAKRQSWDDKGHRPLATTVWYPAAPKAVEDEWNVGVFKAGSSALDAELVSTPKTFPLIVLSHGTGGAALQLSWLAEKLATNGYIVVAVNHHGNTAAEEAYLTEGFILWWERAQDLTSIIDNLLSDSKFGSRIDTSRIGAAGFSLGGYTVMSVAGARTDLSQWKAFCADKPNNPSCQLPPEAGFSLKDIDTLIEKEPNIEKSLAQSGDSFLDGRVKAVYAMAPVQGPALDVESLAKISIPVRLVVGTKDDQAIPQYNAKLMAEAVPGAEIELLPDVAHYTFLANCSLKGRWFVSELCSEPSGVNREKTHDRISSDALDFFNKTLKPETSTKQ